MRRRKGRSGALEASLRAALLPFLVSRALVALALGAAKLYAHHRPHDARAVSSAHAGLLAWDGAWYHRIA
ncbi:MAG: hypothetical protein ACRDZT_04100, partial [Acidimicrobiales bacterium]